MSPRLAGLLGFFSAIAVAALVVVTLPSAFKDKPFRFDPDSYYAVLLNNGQAYFGKVERNWDGFLTLSDVFYIQSKVNRETKETTSNLIKRGKELHGPSHMILNVTAVQYIEPVGKDSQLAKLIAEANNKP